MAMTTIFMPKMMLQRILARILQQRNYRKNDVHLPLFFFKSHIIIVDIGINESMQMKYDMPQMHLASPTVAALGGLYNQSPSTLYNHKRRSLNNIYSTPSGDDSWSVSSGDSSCANSPCLPSPAAFAHQPARSQLTPNTGWRK